MTSRIRSLVLLIVFFMLTACSSTDGPGISRLEPSTVTPKPTTPEASQPPIPTATSVLPARRGVTGGFDGKEQQLITLFEHISPSVVHVRAPRREAGSSITRPSMSARRRDFPGFRGHISDPDGGSGFVLDVQGHILTTNRMVNDANNVEVTFVDGTVRQARVVGRDPNTDLAVLRVNSLPAGIPPVTLGDSDTLRVGQGVLAVGNPLGTGNMLSAGIVSARGRNVTTEVSIGPGQFFTAPDLIQTDATIIPGTVGGPLIDLQGQVVGVLGIDTAFLDAGEGPVGGVAFVIPATTIRRVVPVLLEKGRYPYPWLGISAPPGGLTPEVAQAMGLPPNQQGVLVIEVTPGSPAWAAGLQGSDREVIIDGLPIRVGGDIIIGIRGEPVTSFDALVSLLFRKTSVGEAISLTILRGGRHMEVPLTVQERP